MAKQNVKTLGKHIDQDVELCRTTNPRVGSHAMQMLVAARIPFSKHWMRIPFFRRALYHGAREICVIKTHRNRYIQARKIIESMEIFDRERLFVHAV